jgi:hypothetical protein
MEGAVFLWQSNVLDRYCGVFKRGQMKGVRQYASVQKENQYFPERRKRNMEFQANKVTKSKVQNIKNRV